MLTKFSIVFFCFLFPVWASGQISDRLYKQLPADLRPQNHLHPSGNEQKRIIAYAERYASLSDTLVVAELDNIAAAIKQSNDTATKEAKISNLISLASYMQAFRYVGSEKGEWVPYDREIISLAGDDSIYYRKLCSAYIHIGHYYTNTEQYDLAIKQFFTALTYAQQIRDSGNIRAAYSSIVEAYGGLSLYGQALQYDDLSFRYITAAEEQNGQAYIFRTDDLGFRADLYLDWYVAEKNPAYADSCRSYLHKIPLKGAHAAWWTELYHYGMARYYFELKNYALTIAHIDTALAREDYYAVTHSEKMLIRDISLLKLGKGKEGEADILKNPALGQSPNLTMTAYYSLYEYAKETGNSSAALRYYELARKYEDSAAILQQRGKVFEITQKYDVNEKQRRIDMLNLEALARNRERNSIMLGSGAIILLLLSAIALLYGLNKKRQVNGLQMKHALDIERKKIELFLQRQDGKIKDAESKAILAQRQKISRDLHDGLSSTLAALRYYINDLQLGTDEQNEKHLLQTIEAEVNAIYLQTREYMQNLYKGGETKEINLCDFLSHLSCHFSNPDGFRIILSADTEEISVRLNKTQQTQLYFVLREAIANTMKHAGATLINITVLATNDHCSFRIGDNGKGIAGKIKAGIGIESMKKRIHMLDGRLEIMAGMRGTWINGSFPLYAS
ncbi:sensor histidine kinase [Chitinophagaceae bacterium MMS25-I14]